jgi:hypothetical protein
LNWFKKTNSSLFITLDAYPQESKKKVGMQLGTQSVISTRRVQLKHAQVWFQLAQDWLLHAECDFDTYKCDYDTNECDYDTHE